MALIKAYPYAPRRIDAYDNVWDSEKLIPIPVKSMEDVILHEMLDGITLAVEAGVVDSHAWPQQFFAGRAAFDEFIEQLSDYDACFRITDQWWWALASLVQTDNEEGFVSSSEIADRLYGSAAEKGLLDSWAQNKRAKKVVKKTK